MCEHIHKRHNKTLLLYHIVYSLKYRKGIITKEIGDSLKEICVEISERYEIQFIEVGYKSNHVHLLIQSVPNLSVSEIVRTIKSRTAKQLFQKHPEIQLKLWGGNFLTSGYYSNTVGQYANEKVIRKYVESQKQQKEYKKVNQGQLTLF
jgi:REP element-mobilizing transposase RayT